jgi:hypothetical protein
MQAIRKEVLHQLRWQHGEQKQARATVKASSPALASLSSLCFVYEEVTNDCRSEARLLSDRR